MWNQNVSGLALPQWYINDYEIARENNKEYSCRYSFKVKNINRNLREEDLCSTENFAQSTNLDSLWAWRAIHSVLEFLEEHMSSNVRGPSGALS